MARDTLDSARLNVQSSRRRDGKEPDMGMSRIKYRKELFRSARRLRLVFTEGAGMKDEEYPQRVKELLDAAIAWRESALEMVRKKGWDEKTRPAFSQVPPKPDPQAPPPPKQYAVHLTWWASRYVWDVGDGLPFNESALGLMHTAIVGAHEEEPERPPERSG